jgi:peptide/nickel transport system permease protein
MLRVVVRRLAFAVPLLLVVSTGTYLLAGLLPGDVARTILGQYATPEQYQSLRHSLGLDQPLLTRYWQWLGQAVHGHLGVSPIYGVQVTSLLDSRLSVTFSLVIGATLVAGVVGVLLGIASALRWGGIGRLVDALSLVGLAIPNFFLGLILVAWFAVSIQLFPATGYVPLSSSPSQWLRSLVLPVLTLAVPGIAVIAKQTRDAMLEVMSRPFVRTLRGCGIPRRSIIFKHVLRSAAISVATVIGLVFISCLSGTVLVESVFALPGLGGLAVQATEKHDLPVIQGVVVYFTAIVIVVNLLVDLAYAALDPKVRVS